MILGYRHRTSCPRGLGQLDPIRHRGFRGTEAPAMPARATPPRAGAIQARLWLTAARAGACHVGVQVRTPAALPPPALQHDSGDQPGFFGPWTRPMARQSDDRSGTKNQVRFRASMYWIAR